MRPFFQKEKNSWQRHVSAINVVITNVLLNHSFSKKNKNFLRYIFVFSLSDSLSGFVWIYKMT